MAQKPNIFNYIGASVRFALFWLWGLSSAVVALFVRKGTSFGPKFLRFFMRVEMRLAKIKVRVSGELSKSRPLLIVGNHISIFEIATFPVAFGNSFFAKKEMEKFPLVGWLSKKFGVIYIDRRPSQALAALAALRDSMAKATWPMALFPEGTTTNGAYVKEFKSTLFNFMEDQLNAPAARELRVESLESIGKETSQLSRQGRVTLQPVVMLYRHRDGSKISDEEMAEQYAYFDNAKQDFGPHCSRERSWMAQLFHIFMLGGFMVEMHVLAPVKPPLAGIKDRKELAAMLHKTVSDKYMELK